MAVSAIQAPRIELIRTDGDHRPIDEIVSRPRTAYVVQSLKRREEVQLLREVYGSQFILIGSQGSVADRTQSLLQLNLSSADDAEKDHIVKKLIDIDADERERLGQNVNRTYPQADFFIRNNDRVDINRMFDLLFQKPEAPTIGEYAMYAFRKNLRSCRLRHCGGTPKADCAHGEHTESGTGGKKQEAVLPAGCLGQNRNELDAHGGEAEADGGLGGEGGADEPGIGDLGKQGGEDPGVGDDGSTPDRTEDEKEGRVGAERQR